MRPLVLLLTFFIAWNVFGQITTNGVRLIQKTDRVTVEIDGKLFTEYCYSNTSRPYLFPMLAPGQISMTRHWPMQNPPGEEHDHPHHRAWWYAHGNVNGHDFWMEGAQAGKTVHHQFLDIKSGPNEGILKTSTKWMTAKGESLMTDERIYRFSREGEDRVLDFQITLIASETDLVFGDTKEGTMAMRVAESMRVKGEHATGHILNSEGMIDGNTWGKRARWCAYYGKSEDKAVGVAIFDHPSNFRHPTWWHVRDYGLFAANPFGIHDFEKQPGKPGEMPLKKGERKTFKYRFLFYQGERSREQLDKSFTLFAQ
ncbi:MAG: PmoA family protein [Verrucomicrobiota bacterium]|nr:PmoA family protein [Verrucomicrobiota bacterium]